MRKLSQWLEEYANEESLDILRELTRRLAEELGGGKGQQIVEQVRKGDFLSLCRVPVDYESDSVRDVRYLRQISALWSKLEILDLGIDTDAVTLDMFDYTEDRCRETNVILRGHLDGWVKFPSEMCSVLHIAQGHVARILGERPTLSQLGLRYGPGATSKTPKRKASLKRKLGDGVSCSSDLLGWARALLQEMPHIAQLHAVSSADDGEEWWGVVPVELHAATMSLVVKNYSIKRTTETQPTLNGMGQCAIGDVMAYRASAVPGLNLFDQSLNQRLALIGSLTGEVATLDLKSASNCIAVMLVQTLTPEDWFSLLKAFRCGRTIVPGRGTVELEMFAGMGCGFIFPLQSIIFWSLARACATHLGIDHPVVAVYGDDIIVDTETVPLLVRVLEGCGLLVNKEKSFSSGPFRESCGADYLNGIDVRPVYVKEALTPAVLFTLHNGLVRKGFHDAARWLVETLIDERLRIWGPDSYGDGHLVTQDWRVYLRPSGREYGFGGFTFSTYLRRGQKDWQWREGDRILHTYAAEHRAAIPVFSEQIPSLERRFRDYFDSDVIVKRPWGDCRFIRAWATGHGRVEETIGVQYGKDAVEEATKLGFNTPVEGSDSDVPVAFGPVEIGTDGKGWQGASKACELPNSTVGYRKVRIYIQG